MATYGEIVTNVLSIVPTPGRETLIRNKINQIIRFIAGVGDFWQALEETTIGVSEGVDAASNVQEIPISSTATFRSLLYIKYPESISVIPIEVNHIKNVKSLQECNKANDVAYVSGSVIRIRNSVLTSEFNLGYYTYPVAFAIDGSDDAETNWVLESVPGLVEDLTAAYVLNLIGDNEDSKKISDFVAFMQPSYIRAMVNGVTE